MYSWFSMITGWTTSPMKVKRFVIGSEQKTVQAKQRMMRAIRRRLMDQLERN